MNNRYSGGGKEMIADILQRVSTKKQSKDEKTGLQRQDENITNWLNRNTGYEVRNVFIVKDSSFRRDDDQRKKKTFHEKGEFHDYLESLRSKKQTPPDILIVDDFSRLSRLPYEAAKDLVKELASFGITIVTATDDQVYAPNVHKSVIGELPISIRLEQTHLESLRKSTMIRAAKKSRRDKAMKEGGILKFGNMPKWLEVQNDQYILIPHRVDAIRFMFDCVVSGMSKGATARELNKKGFKGWDRNGNDTENKWDATKVARIIDSKSVTGTHVSRTWKSDTERSSSYMGKAQSMEQGLEIPNAYPRIISDEVFHNAQLKRGSAITKQKKNCKTHNDGTCIIRNAVCSLCGSSMLYKHASRGEQYSEFLCSKRKYGGSCSNSSINYQKAEKAVLTLLFEHVNLSLLFEQDDSRDLLRAQQQAVQDEIDVLNARIKEKKHKHQKVSIEVALLLDDKETELEDIKQQLRAKQGEDFQM
ncbi:hypothetical protein GQ853_05320 [Vibrio parahaemolyticus]|nr:hypothetical protein [Vibrio parahaemolyticus]